jgi:hypothetical protein
MKWATALAVAASLIVGMFLGQGWPGSTREVLLADATLEEAGGRGAGDQQMVRIVSPRNGFATIVRYSPEDTIDDVLIDPESFESALTVAADKPIEYGPLDGIDAGTAIVVIVTETPATETIRRAVGNLVDLPSRPEELRKAILESLWSNGYRWAALAEVAVE